MIDFSNAKSIVIPEGEVSVIARGAEILWKKTGYTELEYIESTGTQWIDTGVKLTSNFSVEIDYQFASVPKSGERKGLFGGLVVSGPRYGFLVSPTTMKLEYGYGSTNVFYQTDFPDTGRHLVKQEKNKVFVDGSLIYTFADATFAQSITAPLGTFNYTNYTPACVKYFSFKLWDGDTLIRDFVPVLDEDGVPCMYDKVTDELFYNAGTGEFLYGTDET